MKFFPLLALGAISTFPALAAPKPAKKAVKPTAKPTKPAIKPVAPTLAPLGEGVPAFQVRPGFRVTLVAKDFGEARFIEFDDKGTLYVSQPGSGTIAALRLKSGTYQKIADFTTDKPRVHGLDFHSGWLWFTQSGSVWKARDTNGDGKCDEEIQVLKDLPEGGGHWWRSILVGDDGFYTSIGDAGNADIPEGDTADRQKIWKYNLDGTGKTLFSEGIRNTEKLRFRPGTNEVYGADHGSDNFGKNLGESGKNQPVTDQIPPCEFNHYEAGKFYGHPFIVGNGMARPEYASRPDILELATKNTLPAWQLGAHWAPNGWNFANTNALGMKGDAFIACHGSWNSSKRVGYRVERVLFDAVTGRAMGAQNLVSTINSNDDVVGRPCDVAEAPNGTLLFSDDQNNAIYRIEKLMAKNSKVSK
ncbi:Glucose/arabinose dehydrogenase, beta-propeller fold [Abditibacterium utsteinense]|uniref:Glucose/arabinose dehydrogenase, beta-propeller fold n=1 Tax=Abditibacterium utsteinense TaxID=1960156 RepID=A0A2S8SQX9_9BACT|nr:PQQ-dependent sugar dehydrogenase [Abditibacterium utsteinense]PQV63214.1 Glucose/arabinose dehydrogenase, beta-propeller fold [Abditibacterium utsteinense]